MNNHIQKETTDTHTSAHKGDMENNTGSVHQDYPPAEVEGKMVRGFVHKNGFDDETKIFETSAHTNTSAETLDEPSNSVHSNGSTKDMMSVHEDIEKNIRALQAKLFDNSVRENHSDDATQPLWAFYHIRWDGSVTCMAHSSAQEEPPKEVSDPSDTERPSKPQDPIDGHKVKGTNNVYQPQSIMDFVNNEEVTAPIHDANTPIGIVHIPGRKFGTEGTNTRHSLGATLAKTITLEDGFTAVAPGEMYRSDEMVPGRREPQFLGIHNLHDEVIERTKKPPPFEASLHERRAIIWDQTTEAIKEALKDIPAGSHINICANSGEHAPKLESLPPWTTVPGAAVGLLLVAQFRDESANIHPAWIQIAVPINETEGRLLAGLRLIPTVADTRDHTFTVTNLTHPTVAVQHMNLVKDDPRLTYGCVANSWRAANLGCFYHRGGMWADGGAVIRASFAWDGDLYGWDECVLYTRRPIVIITDKKPIRRFDYWQPETVMKGVDWLQMVKGEKWAVRGSYQPIATRAQVIEWDKNGVPENLWYN